MSAIARPPGYVPPHWQAINYYKAEFEKAQQQLAEAQARFMSEPSNWIPADKELPGNPRCVLATDGECHYIAVYEINDGNKAESWINAHTSEEIDSVITHWMELPEVPE